MPTRLFAPTFVCAVQPPNQVRGWMQKQAPSGMIKRWKKRFFLLKRGELLSVVCLVTDLFRALSLVT